MADNYDKPVRTFKPSPDGNVGQTFTNDSFSISSKKENVFLTVDKKQVALGGKINMQAMSNDIKIGGLASMNMLPMLLIPSTITTPMSALQVSLPFDAIIELIEAATSMMGLLG